MQHRNINNIITSLKRPKKHHKRIFEDLFEELIHNFLTNNNYNTSFSNKCALGGRKICIYNIKIGTLYFYFWPDIRRCS
jgi:hypothetical protein